MLNNKYYIKPHDRKQADALFPVNVTPDMLFLNSPDNQHLLNIFGCMPPLVN